MRFLLFSAAVLLCSCKSEYKALTLAPSPGECIEKFGKEFTTSWYAATVDVYGKHLSGLLLIKNMGDGTYRTVFTNEAGVSFFDFEFSSAGGFEVKKIIKQLDKKPVINTLREDFSLLLLIPFRKKNLVRYRNGGEVFLASGQKNDRAYFITDPDCASLLRLELGSARKRKASVKLSGEYDRPASVTISHHTFDMVIRLKKIEKE